MTMPVRHLFVVMAEMTKTAHEAAIAGQSEALNARAYPGSSNAACSGLKAKRPATHGRPSPEKLWTPKSARRDARPFSLRKCGIRGLSAIVYQRNGS